MALRKEVKGFGMPWEDRYGYVQALKVDDTIYVSGQLGHDDQGTLVGADSLEDSNMETQMRQTYVHLRS